MKQLILKFIRFYQETTLFHVRPLQILFLTDSACRFQPTCSEYTYQAINHYGIMRGSILGFRRILRCHPWNKGGDDPLR